MLPEFIVLVLTLISASLALTPSISSSHPSSLHTLCLNTMIQPCALGSHFSPFPSHSRSQIPPPHSQKTAAPAPGLARAVQTALMTRDHKHYFPAAAKTPSHFHSGSCSSTLTGLYRKGALSGEVSAGNRAYIHGPHAARYIRNRFREKGLRKERGE